MKFNVGDKVRVKKDLKDDKLYGDLNFWSGDMSETRGQEDIIDHISPEGHYYLKRLGYYYSAQMLERVKRAPKFKEGDRVVILDGSKIEDYTGNWASSMREYVGTTHTVRITDPRDDGRTAYLLEEAGGYVWDERGLKLAEEEKTDA